MNEQKPSIGRIVHLGVCEHSLGKTSTVPYAAIITRVLHDTLADLTVFSSEAAPAVRGSVFYAEDLTPGHWSWPPRV